MLILALSSGHKLGIAIVASAFVLFALVSAFLIPRARADYPGRRGLPFFLLASVALFVGMMSAVFFLGREPKEAKGENKNENVTQTNAQTAPVTTNAGTPAAVKVTEADFKIRLKKTKFAPGAYDFDLTNDGPSAHNLVVKGPNVTRASTATIAKGKKARLDVALTSGTYELYCSVPGHKQAGMDIKITVG